MANIGGMLTPLIILLMVANAMFLFMSYLPSDMQGNANYSFGINDTDKATFEDNATLIGGDFNNLQTQTQVKSGSASVAESTIPEPLKTLLYGLNLAGETVGGTLSAGVQAFSFVAVGLKYLLMAFLGYWFWIDFFINPLWGTAWFFLGLAIKSAIFIIQIFGVANFVLPMFTGWRGN